MPWLESDGLHAFVPGSAPLPEVLDDMTRRYQQEPIRHRVDFSV
jgi:hypothetical protein